MNIAEILYECPRDTKLYSSIFGELSLLYVLPSSLYPIYCKVIRSGSTVSFTEDGKRNITDAEPTLFPAKKQRDWSKFGLSGKKNKHQFKPFDRVLARDSDDEFWFSEQFGHIDSDGTFICGGKKYSQCIPYEGNEHLLGKQINPNNNGKRRI